MTTKSDDGERTCPLCAEEMDLTDQQLKPCRCGYEICVWCWHHIVEMAEKDGGEGRCPACRTPYDKEKIVGAAARCERVVAEIQSDRRTRSQRGRSKSSAEARKHLADVRVVRRNLVYITGLPLTVADVQILKRKEYFGQYGNIVKISISHPGNGAQQSTSGNVVGVYVTYAKEEEAVRCIQAVHNFVLEGKPLRACFGTTKYCHSWIRNKMCSNPDCYYLHDIGNQEDSFSKNETISAYTWSRLPQMSSNNSKCRVGNILPPAKDAFCSLGDVSSSKTAPKSSHNHSATNYRGSPPNESSITVQSTILPTPTTRGSWPSGSTPTSSSCLQGPVHKEPYVNCTKRISACEEGIVTSGKCLKDTNLRTFEYCKPATADESQSKVSLASDVSLSSSWPDDIDSTAVVISESSLPTKLNGRSKSLNASKGDGDEKLHASELDPAIDDSSTRYIASAWDDEDNAAEIQASAGNQSVIASISGCVRELGAWSSDDALKTVSDDRSLENFTSGLPVPISAVCVENSSVSCTIVSPSSCSALSEKTDMTSTPFLGSAHDCSIASNNMDTSTRLSLLKVDDSSGIGIRSDSGLQSSKSQIENLNFVPLDMQSAVPADDFVSGLIRNPSTELEMQAPLPLHNDVFEASTRNISNHYVDQSLAAVGETSGAPFVMPIDRGRNYSGYLGDNDSISNCWSGSFRPNGTGNDEISNIAAGRERFLSKWNVGSRFGSLINNGNSEVSSNTGGTSGGDNGESTTISNILSMDFDPWGDPLSTNNNFLKLLRERSDQNSHLNVPTTRKPQSSNQSRFSFARQDDLTYADMEASKSSTYQDHWSYKGAKSSIFPQSAATGNGHSGISSDRIPVVSSGKVSVPPGFSGQTRAPPPGFSSPVNVNLHSQGFSDTQFSGVLPLGNAIQMPQNRSTTDVEFIDPAILAVVRRSSPVTVPMELNLGSFPNSLSSGHSGDLRFQPSAYQSIPVHQNRRFSGRSTDGFSHLNGVSHLNDHPPSLPAEHKFGNSSHNSSHMQIFHPLEDPYNQRNRQSNIQLGNELAEVLRIGHGSNSNFLDSENYKFHMANPSNLYSRPFGF